MQFKKRILFCLLYTINRSTTEVIKYSTEEHQQLALIFILNHTHIFI